MKVAVFLLHTALAEARLPRVADLSTGLINAVAASGMMAPTIGLPLAHAGLQFPTHGAPPQTAQAPFPMELTDD